MAIHRHRIYPLGDTLSEAHRLTELARRFPQRRLHARLRPGMRVLDVGCGPGAVSVNVGRHVEPGGRVVGLDRSAAYLAFARSAAARRGQENVRFIRADAVETPFPPDHFDLVFSKLVLGYVDDPIQAVREMVRVTRPGGRVVLIDLDSEAWTFDPPDGPASRAWHLVEEVIRRSGSDPFVGRRLAGFLDEAGAHKIRVATADAYGHVHAPGVARALRRQLGLLVEAVRASAVHFGLASEAELTGLRKTLLIEPPGRREFIGMSTLVVQGVVPPRAERTAPR